jgi:hypothetical protein
LDAGVARPRRLRASFHRGKPGCVWPAAGARAGPKCCRHLAGSGGTGPPQARTGRANRANGSERKPTRGAVAYGQSPGPDPSPP